VSVQSKELVKNRGFFGVPWTNRIDSHRSSEFQASFVVVTLRRPKNAREDKVTNDDTAIRTLITRDSRLDETKRTKNSNQSINQSIDDSARQTRLFLASVSPKEDAARGTGDAGIPRIHGALAHGGQ